MLSDFLLLPFSEAQSGLKGALEMKKESIGSPLGDISAASFGKEASWLAVAVRKLANADDARPVGLSAIEYLFLIKDSDAKQVMVKNDQIELLRS